MEGGTREGLEEGKGEMYLYYNLKNKKILNEGEKRKRIGVGVWWCSPEIREVEGEDPEFKDILSCRSQLEASLT